jgi:hypothetical protein
LLAAVTHVLPFIFANWAMRRRFHSFSELRPALHTDEIFHEKKAVCFSTETVTNATFVASFTKRKVRSEVQKETERYILNSERQ